MRHTRVGGVLMLVLLLVTTAAVTSAAPAQAPAEPQAPPRTLTGTWVILLEGHQVGLEVEDTAGTLEATLHIMGQRVLLDGDMKDGRFTLTSDAQVGTQHSGGATVKMKLTGTHKPDDTLEGTIDLPHGPMNWTAERLRKP